MKKTEVDRGACPKCGVIFASKTARFNLEEARCPYCKGTLVPVSDRSTLPIRWMNPPTITTTRQRKGWDLLVSESIFGRIPFAGYPDWRIKK